MLMILAKVLQVVKIEIASASAVSTSRQIQSWRGVASRDRGRK